MGKSNFIINTGRIQGDINQENTVMPPNLTAPNDARNTKVNNYRYDVAVSYASEQELYVTRTAKILEKEHLKVFFAPNREEEFLGRDMITEFYDIYRYESMFVACFISEDYLKKDITMHEAKIALLRTKEEKRNCLIPVYWGKARLVGLDPDIHFLNADLLREVEVAEKIKLIVNKFKETSTASMR